MLSRDIKGWDSLLSFLKQSAELPERGMCEKINKQLLMEAGRSMWDLLAWQSRPSDYGDLVRRDGWGVDGGHAAGALWSVIRLNNHESTTAAITLNHC